jgi:hypothetical protein
MAPSDDGAFRIAGGDARLWVRFEKKAVKNAFKSEMEGRPIYEEVNYVRIQQPGERDVYNQPATQDHIRRFPKQWEAFQKGAEQIPEGTPIALLFPNEEAVREVLLDLKILTVEQLASCSEHAIERLGMDGRRYVAKAKAALDKSEALKEVTLLTHKYNESQDQIKVLQDANARLIERVQRLEDREAEEREEEPVARRRGRPPKQQQESEWSAVRRAQTPPPERSEVVG